MAEPTEALRRDAAPAVPGGLVLFADDERVIVRIGRAALERAGFRVATASDGVAALELLERFGDQACALVLDLALPHLAGTAILDRLAREGSELPVLIATGLDDPALGAVAGRGRRALLPKPYLPSQLVAHVRALLEADAPRRGL